jgi:prolycopene isomerase
MGTKSNYPTVIIGAGLGGLSCGAYLSRQGIPVTIVEQADRPGGYAVSFERAGGKFIFDVSLHGMAANDNAAARVLNDLGVLKDLHLIELPEIYRLKTPDLEIALPPRDPQKYINVLIKQFPDEREGIQGFIKEIVGIAEEGDRLHRKGRYSKLLFPFQYPKMWNALKKNLDQLMDGYVRNPALRNVLASLWDFHGLPPSKVSGLYYAAAKGDSLTNGTYYIKRRSRDLSDALAQIIESAGGQILYDTSVEKILLEKERVRGVVASGGQVIPARAVVSNANVLDTFKRMLPREAVPGDYVRALETYKPSLATFIVWLGLNQDIREGVKSCGVQVLSRRGPEAEYKACLNGDIERMPFRISAYDNMYEGYSSPGTSTIRILSLSSYGPWGKYAADYKAGRKRDYDEEKRRWTDTLIRRAEEVIPGLASMIEVLESATPLTNWRYTRNPGGAIYGFEQSVDNAYIQRVDHRTPINGLYLASAWSSPGGGFSGVLVGGQMAFQKIMEDWVK